MTKSDLSRSSIRMRRHRLSETWIRTNQHARHRWQFPRVAVPSFFTLMNGFSGFLAITQVHEGHFVYGCYLIVLAGFFDLLDGMSARVSQGQSLFGVELDSLSDMVSFGVAPSYLVYAFALRDFGIFGIIVSGLPAMCAIVRLARYNVAYVGERGDYFRGLPVPVHAFVIITFVLNASGSSWLFEREILDNSALFPVILILSVLMVTNIAFEGTPKPTIAYLVAKPLEATGYGVGIVLIVLFHELGLLIGLAAYLLTGIIRTGYRAIRAATRPSAGEDSTNLS